MLNQRFPLVPALPLFQQKALFFENTGENNAQVGF